MPRHRLPRLALCAVALACAVPALAHHRQTPEIVPLATGVDVALPRLPAPGRTTVALAVPSGADTQIQSVKPYKNVLVTPLATVGDNQNPAVSVSGSVIAWDTDADPASTGLPGRQVVLAKSGFVLPGPADPSGTSTNPSVDTAGLRIAFESTGDLAGTGNPGIRQVFLRQPAGSVSQASSGLGASANAALAPRLGRLAFESASDPADGHDTGIAQIWLGTVTGVPAVPVTDGFGPSTRPSFSTDGAIVTFQSTADLAGDKHDTGVPQIFAYDVKSRTTAQLTLDAGGCTDPAVGKVGRDWRVGFVCGGAGFFFMLREDQRYTVSTPGGDTTRLVPELGKHFVVMATTFDLVAGSGTTPGHSIYLVNLFKHPAAAVVGPPALWFPFRGVKPL